MNAPPAPPVRLFMLSSEGVHLMGDGEFTLCGDAFDIGATEDDSDDSPELYETKRRTVTCPRCIDIIRLCRGVRTA